MRAMKQWNISKALAIASCFHFFHNVGNFCVLPFLTIYFRYLGLGPPLVGIIMGIKHFIYVFWAPLCSFLAKTNSKRRILIISSLLLSAGAGLALTIYPPLEKDVVFKHCNASIPWGSRLTTPGALDMEMFGPEDNVSVTLPDSSMAYMFSSTISANLGDSTTIAKFATETKSPPETSENLHTTKSPTPNRLNSITKTPRVVSNGSHSDSPPKPNAYNYSVTQKKVRALPMVLPEQEPFLNAEHKIFLIVLGIIAVWEVFTAPLEWTADDSLYEYLDFVDATDRHGKVWIWRYMGACLGSCSIVLLIENLNCFLLAETPRLYLHFYAYSIFMILALFLSAFYPIHVSKKTEHTNKTIKALGLIGSDARLFLLSVTVFLTGAMESVAQNFLFWQMQDIGSSELYMGTSITIALFSEVVLHFFRDRLLKAISLKWTVALSLGCLSAQLLYYSIVWAPWAVLPIQILSAFSNGALMWAVNSQADDVATPGTERSLQLVLQFLCHSCGASIGSFAGGFIASSFSLSILFQACCVTLLLWLVIILIIHPKLPHIKKINYSRLLAADNSDMSDSEDEQERDWLVKAMKDDNKIW